MSKFALQARWVVPIEAPPIAHGVVTVEEQRIVAVGKQADRGVEIRDLGEVVLLPGLVNAHTHLEFSHLVQPLGHPGIPMPDWVRLVIASRKQQTDAAATLVLGLQESLRYGVTTLGDIATAASIVANEVALPALVAFQEVIGFSAARVESVFAELLDRLTSNRDPFNSGISPHAPYTVHPELLVKLVHLAAEQHLPIAMHLAESPEELQLMRSNSGPFRELLEERSMWDGQIFAEDRMPLHYLHLLLKAPRSLVIHGNYLSLEEIEFLGKNHERMSVVYCPRTHTYFQHESYPLRQMLDARVRIAVGTDSRASNPDLNLLEELRHMARKFSEISPEQVLAIGTIHGAEALGLDGSVGSLAPGKLANMTTIGYCEGEQSPLQAILYGDRQPLQTWLRGRELMFE